MNQMNRVNVVPAGMTLQVPAGGIAASQPTSHSYSFVMNVAELIGGSAFTIAPGHELRRGTAQEIARIRDILSNRMPEHKTSLPWEWRLLENGKAELLPEAEWRYFVIARQGNIDFADIEEAINLAPLELKIAFTVVPYDFAGRVFPGVMFYPGRLFYLLEDARWGRITFLDVRISDTEQVQLIHSRLQNHDHSLVDVKRLARQLMDLEALPPLSPLQLLGYFAVLEALLTHPPQPGDQYDSITRQIKKKIALLNHRCDPAIDYSRFSGVNTDKTWSRMYSYRSDLAHGGVPTFDDKLKLLGSHNNALKLIKESVKAVMRQALIEPQLLSDLRHC
jgi:hypothetical protein